MVDVLATFQPDDKTRSPASARTIIRRARIVTIGLPRAAAPSRAAPTTRCARPTPNAQQVLVPVTFALRPTLSLRLTYAETFASEIRLSLIRRGDETRKLAPHKREYTLPPTRARTPEANAMRARLALGLTDSDRAAQVIALAEEAGEIDGRRHAADQRRRDRRAGPHRGRGPRARRGARARCRSSSSRASCRPSTRPSGCCCSPRARRRPTSCARRCAPASATCSRRR